MVRLRIGPWIDFFNQLRHDGGMYDVIIIGAGAAGLTAGIYTGRRGLKTLILSKDLGGQTASTAEIENYPGVGRVEGSDLIDTFRRQAEQFGCEIVFQEVTKVTKDGETFNVVTPRETYTAQTIILACGKTPRDLGIPDEMKWKTRGLDYCSVWDLERYRGKTVAVVGGGNSALDTVGRISPVAKKIYVIHRREGFTGEKILIERLSSIDILEKIMNATVLSLNGEEHIESITIKDSIQQEEKTIPVDAVFAAVGFELRTDFIKDLVVFDEAHHVCVDHTGASNVPGIFAAGDITQTPHKQIIISAGEGARAALSAYQYIVRKAGKRPLAVDWGFLP